MPQEIKKGDVIWIDGRWGVGVLGIVESYEERTETLTLRWPSKLFSRFNNPQPFSPVKLREIQILSASEALEKISILLENSFGRLAEISKEALHKAVFSVTLM